MCSPPFLKASRIGGELGSAAVKLVEEATGRSDAGADGGAGGAGAEPLESYFCARSPSSERGKEKRRKEKVILISKCLKSLCFSPSRPSQKPDGLCR